MFLGYGCVRTVHALFDSIQIAFLFCTDSRLRVTSIMPHAARTKVTLLCDEGCVRTVWAPFISTKVASLLCCSGCCVGKFTCTSGAFLLPSTSVLSSHMAKTCEAGDTACACCASDAFLDFPGPLYTMSIDTC